MNSVIQSITEYSLENKS